MKGERRRRIAYWNTGNFIAFPDEMEVLAFLLLALGGVLGWSLLDCAWSRRWQLFDYVLGFSNYTLLPCAYAGRTAGVLTVQGDEHDHGHEDGPHEIVVVEERWAVITGASRGLGRAYVRALSDMGFCMLCIDADDEDLEATVAEAQRRLERGHRGGVWARTMAMPIARKLAVDLAAVDSAVYLCEQQIAELPVGALRLLVNASTGVRPESVASLGEPSGPEVQQLLATSMLLSVRLTSALWPKLSERDRSGVLFASSAPTPMPALAPVHAASEGAVHAFARALRTKTAYGGLKIDVLALKPPGVRAGNAQCSTEDIARSSLLLLPTARAASMAPLLIDALQEARLRVLPKCLSACYVFSSRNDPVQRDWVGKEE